MAPVDTWHIAVSRLLRGVRQKAFDALRAQEEGEMAAAKALSPHAMADVTELRRLWKERLTTEMPSNLARHVHFWMKQDWFDILGFDIPEIEQAMEQLLQSAVNEQAPIGFENLLHPVVLKHGYRQFRDGHLRDAVLNSFIAVFDQIRTRTGLDADGEALITAAFSERHPSLVLSELQSTSGKNDQIGFMQIFQGAYKGIRNPKAHTLDHDLTEIVAAQYLVFASLLARRVEEAHLAIHQPGT